MARYIILGDGETWDNLDDCLIYDSDTKKMYIPRKGREILSFTAFHKGINLIRKAIGIPYEEDKGMPEPTYPDPD